MLVLATVTIGVLYSYYYVAMQQQQQLQGKKTARSPKSSKQRKVVTKTTKTVDSAEPVPTPVRILYGTQTGASKGKSCAGPFWAASHLTLCIISYCL